MTISIAVQNDYGKEVLITQEISEDSPLPELARVFKSVLLASEFQYITEVLFNKNLGGSISSEDWE